MANDWVLVFSDGTGQRGVREDGNLKNSNIFRMHLAAESIFRKQSFYDPGIGTPEEGEPEWATWGFNLLSKASGLGISSNIAQCFAHLMLHDSDDRKIGIFGFSRGAYTVRCLGGVLSAVGVPKAFPKGSGKADAAARLKIAAEAVEIYKLSPLTENEERVAKIDAFRTTYKCVNKWPHVVGVFDTVGALGLPVLTDMFGVIRHVFHDRSLNKNVKVGLQALAIDEDRKIFKPVLWDNAGVAGAPHIEQVWFPGAHSDIGGGYADDRQLADATLSWMCGRLNDLCGLDLGIKPAFKKEMLLGVLHNERTGFGKFWQKGDRTWSGDIAEEGKLFTRGVDDSRLCAELEHRFSGLSSYRPKPTRKHPRLSAFY
jgi:uncharacterized protein (DUF2235 family)